MTRPGIPQRTIKPPKALRVLSADGSTTVAPSIVMPRAKTELSHLLAGDDAICVRPRRESPVTYSSDAATSQAFGDDLSKVIAAWPRLTQGVRTAVLAMVDATK